MPEPHVIGRLPSETPSDLQTEPGRPRRLPDDLLRQATKRFQILTLLAAGLWLLGPLLAHVALYVIDPGDPHAAEFRFIDGIAVFAFFTSIGLYFLLRTTRRSPTFVLNLGLVYLVLTAIDLGIMLHWGPVPMREV